MTDTLINHYEAIETSSAQMLAFAAAAEWIQANDCERRCGELIGRLREAQPQAPLTPEQRLRKRQIMKHILAMDAQIRHLAEPATARYAQRYRLDAGPAR